MSLLSDINGGTRQLHGVTKLTGKATYQRWSLALKLYLKNDKSWAVVASDSPRPPTASAAETVDAWVNKDDSAKYTIISMINEEQQDKLFRLGDNATSKQFWDLLRAENKVQGDVGLQVLLAQMHSCRYVGGTFMEKYLGRCR
jgi:hypothetical protein